MGRAPEDRSELSRKAGQFLTVVLVGCIAALIIALTLAAIRRVV